MDSGKRIPLTKSFHVVIPAYNEAASVGRVIHSVLDRFPEAHIIVVDDGSTDGTTRAAQAAGAKVVRMPFNSGYGMALQTGLRWARQHGARYVVMLDADGQHDPKELPAILEPVLRGRADVAVGSRYLSSRARYRIPVARRLGSWIFAKLLSILTGGRITDPTSGFQCLSAAALEMFSQIEDFPPATPDADMLLYAHLEGLRICEVPVTMYADEGQDSMHSFARSFFYAPKMVVAMAGVLVAWHRREAVRS